MNPDQENDDYEVVTSDAENSADDSVSVDDFIRQLEEREKDLHITVDTTIIEIAESFDDSDLPEFLRQDLDLPVATVSPAPISAVQDSKVDREPELQAEIDRLRTSLAKMEEERGEIFKNSQRRSKDFASYKARAERERTETFQNQVGNLATFLLPALDNFSRALDSAERLNEQKSTEFQQFFEGVTIVNRQMYEILEKMGIRSIPTVGEFFDPNFHEAVAVEESSEMPDNVICEELARGFCIGDRVIRHSIVKVVKNKPSTLRKEDRSDDSAALELEFPSIAPDNILD
jgi:Molecular chaperone GrpE (heat shock protein)